MKKILLLSILTLFSFNSEANIFPSDQQYGKIIQKELNFREDKINYFIYFPKEFKKINKEKEIFLIFHGHYSKAEDFLNKTNLANELKNKNKTFIVFNSNANDWFSHKSKNEKDKMFISEMFEYINSRFNKINIIGYSSGGTLINEILCNNYAKKVSRVIVNNASVTESNLKCNLRGIEYIYIAGNKENYYGFEKKNNDTYLSLSDSKDYIRRSLNCNNDFISLEIEKDISDNTFAKQFVYNCSQKENNKFQYIEIQDMGNNFINTIPDDVLKLKDFEGNTNKDIKITDFFK